MTKNIDILLIVLVNLCFSMPVRGEEHTQQSQPTYKFCVSFTSGMNDSIRYLEQFSDRTPENNTRLMENIAKEVIDEGHILAILPNGNVVFNRREYAPEIVDIVGTEMTAKFLYKEIEGSEIVGYTRLLPEIRSNTVRFDTFTIFSSGCTWLSKSCEPMIDEYVCTNVN